VKLRASMTNWGGVLPEARSAAYWLEVRMEERDGKVNVEDEEVEVSAVSSARGGKVQDMLASLRKFNGDGKQSVGVWDGCRGSTGDQVTTERRDGVNEGVGAVDQCWEVDQ
jgi:hypothetical protein